MEMQKAISSILGEEDIEVLKIVDAWVGSCQFYLTHVGLGLESTQTRFPSSYIMYMFLGLVI